MFLSMQLTFVLLSDSAKEARMGGRGKLRKKVKGCPTLSVRFILESNLRLPGSPYTFSFPRPLKSKCNACHSSWRGRKVYAC